MGGIGIELVKAQNDRSFAAGNRYPPVPHHHAITDNVDGDARVADKAKLIDPLAFEFAKS
jgi:hypothetical protein